MSQVNSFSGLCFLAALRELSFASSQIAMRKVLKILSVTARLEIVVEP